MDTVRRHAGLILLCSMTLCGGATIYFGFNLFKTLRTQIALPTSSLPKESRGKLLEMPSLKPREQYELVVRRNIFSLNEPSEAAPKPQAPQAPVETPLNVKLKGTAVSPGGLALALIEDPAQRREDLYIVGDKLQDAQILRILPDKVVLQRSGREETLSLFTNRESKAGAKLGQWPQASRGAKGIVPSAQAFHSPGSVSPRESKRAVQTLMAKLRLRPHFQEGRPSGFMVGEVPKGSVFEAAGLKVGDIVVGINDEEVRTPNQLLKAYKEVSEVRELWLDVLRNGQEETIEVEIQAALPQR